MTSNLSQIDYADKAAVSANIEVLFKEADVTSAYSLSLPLIASAQQGDLTIYKAVKEKFVAALNGMPSGEFKAWLLGRYLLAANSINEDAETIEAIRKELSQEITKSKAKETTQYNSFDYAFYAWAVGYLAALNPKEYSQLHTTMLASATNLTQYYKKLKTDISENSSDQEKNNLHDAESNAVWAWVMDLQAAGNVNDQSTYRYILDQIKSLANQPTVSAAIQTTLTRNESSSDYPAWALGIISQAAAKMQDVSLYDETQAALANALTNVNAWEKTTSSASNQWKAKAESLLGELNQELARANASSIQHATTPKIVR